MARHLMARASRSTPPHLLNNPAPASHGPGPAAAGPAPPHGVCADPCPETQRPTLWPLLLPAPQQIRGEAEISGDLGSRVPALRHQFHRLALEFRRTHSSGSPHGDHLLGEQAPPFSRCPLFRGKIKVALGFVEGLNNKIRVLQRRVYGLRDEEYRRLKILTCMLPEI